MAVLLVEQGSVPGPFGIEPSEPISPELVLVAPELRTLAVAAMWQQKLELPTFAARATDAAGADAPSDVGGRIASRTAAAILLYAAWQMVLGALFGLAAVAAVATSVLVLSLIA